MESTSDFSSEEGAKEGGEAEEKKMRMLAIFLFLPICSFSEGTRLKLRYVDFENTRITDHFHGTYQLGFDLTLDGDYWMSSLGTYVGWFPDQISLSTEIMIYGRYPGKAFQPFLGIGPDIDYLPIHNGMEQLEGTFRNGGWGPKLKWGSEILRRFEVSFEYKPWNLTSSTFSVGCRM